MASGHFICRDTPPVLVAVTRMAKVGTMYASVASNYKNTFFHETEVSGQALSMASACHQGLPQIVRVLGRP